MTESIPEQLAATIWALWCAGETIEQLPETLRPQTEADGQAAQDFISKVAADSIRGWKIAATSAGGQNAINVSSPLEGPYLASRTHSSGVTISMAGNHMAVAEAEFAFEFATSLPPRSSAYSRDEIVNAVGTLRPSLELPDSRIGSFRQAGEASLLADCAAARDCVLGTPTEIDWRAMDLAECATQLIINGEVASEATGADALGHHDRCLRLAATHKSRGYC